MKSTNNVAHTKMLFHFAWIKGVIERQKRGATKEYLKGLSETVGTRYNVVEMKTKRAVK